MKKIYILILSLNCILLAGCTNVDNELNKYRKSSNQPQTEWQDMAWKDTEWSHYYEKYYKNSDEECMKLEKEIKEIVGNNSEGFHMGFEAFIDENYHYIYVEDVDSEEGKQVLPILKKFMGTELGEMIKNVKGSEKGSKKDEMKEEKVINDYGVICTKYDEKISLNILKSNISLIE